MAGKAPPRKPSPNGAPTLTPLGHYAGRPDIALSRQITVVGSKAGSRLHLASSTVSQSHAVIVNSASGAYIRDLASRTHVIVNGKAQREADLDDGTLLQIGKFKFQFNAGVAGAGLVEPGRSAPVGTFDPAPRAALTVEGGEMPVPVEGRTVLIGRRPTSDVPLIEDSVSTAHAIIFEMNGKRFIRDLNSRTGTFVNGERVEQVELAFGDEIKIGDTQIVYAGASGEVAEREVDELDHLMATAPLGTAALPDLAPDAEAEDKHGTAAGHAIPVEAGESKHGEELITPVVSEPAHAHPASEQREPEPVAPDQVRLDADPDVGAGPGDTRVLPAEKVPDKPRKLPTLKARPVEAEAPAAPGMDAPGMDAPGMDEASVVDDALGLTPEARRREEAKAEDLGGSRRGWRGMPAEEPVVPGVVEPVAQPEGEAEAEPTAPQQVEPEPPIDVDEAPLAEPEPAVAVRDDDDTLASASPVERVAEAPSAHDEPLADHVTVGEEVAPTATPALPPETFEMTEDVSAPLADAEREPPEALHLPPILDDGADEIDVEPLPLTPEQGAPLDLTVEEPPIDIDAPTPELKLDEPAESFDDAATLTASEDAGRIEDPTLLPAEPAHPTAAELAAPEPASLSEAPPPDLEPVAEAPVAEPAKKGKRKRAPRKKKGAAAAVPPVETPVEASAAPESPAPEHAPQPVAEAPRDAVEVLDETQPTPESAQAIEDLAADVLSEPLPLDDASVVSSEASALTDTGFGRAVDSFVGESTGPLVEPRQDEAVSETHAAPDAEIELAAPAPPVEIEAEAGTSPVAEADAADELAALQLDDEPAEPEAVAETHFDAEAEAADALAEHAAAEATEPAAHAAEAEASEAEKVAAAPSIDDLLKDVLDPAGEQEANAAAASPDDTAVDGPALVLEEPEVEPLSEVPEVEQPGLQPTTPAAEAPEPVESKSEPSPASPPPPAAPQTSPPPPGFGANQEHFLGGMPLKLNKPLNPAGNAASAAARAPGAGPGRGPMMPPPPPRATRPNARTRNPFDLSPGDVPAATDMGASIPPYVGNSPKSGTITTGFDGLAMPPVRQTDVFSQMPATPAAFAAGLAGAFVDDEIFSRGVNAAGPAQPTKSSPDEPATAETAAPTPKEPAETIENASDASSPASAPHDDLHEPSPADAVWADDAGVASTDDEQPVGAAAESARPARVLPTPPSFPGAPVATADAPKRRRRWFGLRFLLLLMLLLGAAAAGGIYGFVKKQTEVVGRLRFHNVEALKTIEQQNLLKQQQQLVNDPSLRDAARALLLQQNPTITPGFLGDVIAYERFANTADWAANARGAFEVRHSGNDPAGDDKRVRAVMLALYDANAQRAAKASGENGGGGKTISETVEALSAAHTKAQQRVNDLRVQIERLNVVAQQKLDPAQLEALTAEVARLDQAYTDARRKAKDVSDDVERIRQALPANPQPAGTAQAPVVDEELTRLQAELDETNQKLAAARTDRAKAAEAAQASLDAALEQFQKGIAGAQDLAQDNPELAAYVTAAQKLQTSTRELTEQLIRRQQQQQQQLAELKQRLSDKMEARRADAWKKDPKLQEYGDQLAIVQRQYNAAVGGGATKEAEDFKAQVGMLEQMIKARQALIGDDAFYADAIAQLQKMIDSSQRSLEGDRRQTEAVLEEMQAAFTKSQPTVEKMTGAQKELAAALEKQLAGVNAARKQYTQAAEAAAASADDEQAKAAATVLAAKIEARRKDLAAQADKAATAEQEQARVAQLKQREQELVAAQSAEMAAQKDWEVAQKKLRDAQIAESEAREAGENRDALAAQRVAAQNDLEKTLAQLELKQQIARSTVEPIAPTENDVQMTVHDPRPVYALASVGGIVAVFTLLALFTAGGADREAVAPIADLSPFDARPTPAPMPRMNGNGSAAQHADEDAPRVAV